MRLQYVGGFDAIEVPLPDTGIQVTCERDGTAEFPDEIAVRLLEQAANWAPAPPPAKKSKDGGEA